MDSDDYDFGSSDHDDPQITNEFGNQYVEHLETIDMHSGTDTCLKSDLEPESDDGEQYTAPIPRKLLINPRRNEARPAPEELLADVNKNTQLCNAWLEKYTFSLCSDAYTHFLDALEVKPRVYCPCGYTSHVYRNKLATLSHIYMCPHLLGHVIKNDTTRVFYSPGYENALDFFKIGALLKLAKATFMQAQACDLNTQMGRPVFVDNPTKNPGWKDRTALVEDQLDLLWAQLEVGHLRLELWRKKIEAMAYYARLQEEKVRSFARNMRNMKFFRAKAENLPKVLSHKCLDGLDFNSLGWTRTEIDYMPPDVPTRRAVKRKGAHASDKQASNYPASSSRSSSRSST